MSYRTFTFDPVRPSRVPDGRRAGARRAVPALVPRVRCRLGRGLRRPVRQRCARRRPGRPPSGCRRVGGAVRLRGRGTGARRTGEVPQRAWRPCRGSRRTSSPPATPLLAGVSGRVVVSWAPTTPARRRARGFDQAEVLARAVARTTRLPCRGLLRRLPGPPQTGLPASERRRGPRFVAVRSAAATLRCHDATVLAGRRRRHDRRHPRAAAVALRRRRGAHGPRAHRRPHTAVRREGDARDVPGQHTPLRS